MLKSKKTRPISAKPDATRTIPPANPDSWSVWAEGTFSVGPNAPSKSPFGIFEINPLKRERSMRQRRGTR